MASVKESKGFSVSAYTLDAKRDPYAWHSEVLLSSYHGMRSQQYGLGTTDHYGISIVSYSIYRNFKRVRQYRGGRRSVLIILAYIMEQI